MARFLISMHGGAGHLAPAIPIARQLVARGHEVWWHAELPFEATVAATGAHFVPVNAMPKYAAMMAQGEMRQTGLGRMKAGPKNLMVVPMLSQLQDYQTIMAEFPADVVLADSMTLGPALLHEQGGPPWASLGISILTVSDPAVGPFGMALPPARSFFDRRRYQTIKRRVLREVFQDLYAEVNAMRASVDLPPWPADKPLHDVAASPFLYLQGTTPAFEYPRRRLPRQVHFIGPLMPAASTEFTPPPWWNDLTADRPVVLVTQGTVANEADNLLIPTLHALANEDVLVVATTATDATYLGIDPLPTNARVAAFIPYAQLLPHVSVMITNGGYSGVQMALAHGIPLIAAGETQEKPEICNRIAWSGAGINLHTKAPTPQQIRDAVHTILHTPTYRQNATRIRDDFAHHDAPTEAAILLERLAATKQPIF